MVKILLDTHIFLWSLADPDRIPDIFRTELEAQSNPCYVSSISIAEIMIKASIGKLLVAFDPVEEVKASGFELLPFGGADALPLKDLVFHHRDPFDRMLIAHSITQDLHLMTCDAKFAPYPCKLM